MKKYIPHFRRNELYPEWGRSPEGEEGEQYYHVAVTYTPFNQPEYDVNLFRACLNTTNKCAWGSI